jgi:L,D-peptidoglycan transpeptidase YkuD (ErfK/YbiS/YcfS/YnhG family)
VGRNGVSADKREGDGCTPAGLFGFGFAFGNSAKPETGMTWRDVTSDSYWVDDPNSLYYNQWVEGRDNADWTSAEHLSESPKNYAYAVVVDYNTENTIAGNGSAIFLHCKTEPTSGCVAAPQESILKILKWLSEGKNPGILIAGK